MTDVLLRPSTLLYNVSSDPKSDFLFIFGGRAQKKEACAITEAKAALYSGNYADAGLKGQAYQAHFNSSIQPGQVFDNRSKYVKHVESTLCRLKELPGYSNFTAKFAAMSTIDALNRFNELNDKNKSLTKAGYLILGEKEHETGTELTDSVATFVRKHPDFEVERGREFCLDSFADEYNQSKKSTKKDRLDLALEIGKKYQNCTVITMDSRDLSELSDFNIIKRYNPKVKTTAITAKNMDDSQSQEKSATARMPTYKSGPSSGDTESAPVIPFVYQPESASDIYPEDGQEVTLDFE